MRRLNITLPDEIVKELRHFSNRSRFIAEALKERLERIKKEELDKLLVEGYMVSGEEDRTIAKDWEEITLEGWG